MEKHILESQGSMTRDKQVSLPEVIRLWGSYQFGLSVRQEPNWW